MFGPVEVIHSSGIHQFFLFAALLVAVVCGVFHAAQARDQYEDDEPVEYIFQVLLVPGWLISDAVFAYEREGKYYLPVHELSTGFEFFTESEAGRKYVSGFAGQESNNFMIDGERGELIIHGQKYDLPADAFLDVADPAAEDLYVNLDVLNRVWPVEMSVDLGRLAILVTAEEKLSFMRAKDREAAREKASVRREKKKKKEDLPYHENPYKWIGKPVIDYQAVYKYNAENRAVTGQNIFNGRQQIGKMIADYAGTVTMEEDGDFVRPDSVRLKFERSSTGRDYLAPGVRRLEFGDVSLPQKDLIDGTSTGRGIVISNDNNFRESAFDEVTLEGTGPPGWEIEIYNNEELIEFGTVPDNGKYIFEDFALAYGNNQVKILLFGPQGQVREENRSYETGGNMLPPGEFRYKAGIVDTDRDFIYLDDDPVSAPHGHTRTLEASVGLKRWLTLNGSITRLPVGQEEKKHYATIGATASTPVGMLDADIYKEANGGHAFDVRLATGFEGYRVNLRTSLFNHFESQDAGSGVNAKRLETEARISKNARIFLLPVGLRLVARHTERENGASETNLNFSQSVSRGGIRVSNTLTSRFSGKSHQKTNGNLQATAREGDWQFRGGLSYDLIPAVDRDLTAGNFNIRYTPKDNPFRGALNGSYNFASYVYSAGLQFGYDFDKALTTLESSYEKGNGWEFVFRLSTSLHPYTPDQDYTLSSASKRGTAPVLGHVFLDKNGNGVYDEEEDEPMENVGLMFDTAHNRARTDENGYVVAGGSHNERFNIAIDKATLSDPYYVPATKGVSTVTTYGGMPSFSFPVVESGAIEGTVFRRSDPSRSVSGLTLDLLDKDGGIVSTTTTAFDGFYTFEFIAPGTYRIETDKIHDLKLLENAAEIKAEELFLYGHDLTLNDPDAPKPKARILPEGDLEGNDMPLDVDDLEAIDDVETMQQFLE